MRVGTAWSVEGQEAVLELIEVVAVGVPAARLFALADG